MRNRVFSIYNDLFVAVLTLMLIVILFTSTAMAQAPDAVTLTSPSSTTVAAPTFEWSEASGASWYKLFIQSTTSDYKFVQWYEIEDNFSNYPEVSCVSGQCTITISSDLPSDSYTWYIRGWNDDGNGEWSSGMSFSIASIDSPSKTITRTPSGTIEGKRPSFTWDENASATWYKLYLKNSATGAKFVQWYETTDNNPAYPEVTCSDGQCSVTLNSELETGSSEWYVRGWNSGGNGEWSDKKSFIVERIIVDTSTRYETTVVDSQVWSFQTDERNPDYEYAGQWYTGSVVSFFPQGQSVADFWTDGFPDILVPLNKGYATGIDTRIKPLLFKNNGSGFREAGDEVVGGLTAIPGLRRVGTFSDQTSGISGVFGVAHDTGDGNHADALLLTAGSVPSNMTSSLPRLPLANTAGRDNAVDAHSMATGDLTGNGLTDFIVGEWRESDGPYKLIQEPAGQWLVEKDTFLRQLAYEQPLVNSSTGENNNLLLDIHLADFNGDGFDDLVAGWGHGSSYSYVYFNDGQGGFSDSRRIRLPESIYGIDNNLHLKTFSFDADSDGDQDLLIIHSRYDPYYGGYTFQLLSNDGGQEFTDRSTSNLHAISGRERTYAGRLQWSDNFYLIDVNQDGFVDIVGSDFDGVRLWLSNGAGEFFELEVDTLDELQGGIFMFADMGGGRTSSLVFRQGWIDSQGTENRIWFEQVDLIPE